MAMPFFLVPKSFRYTQSCHSGSLPLMREVDSPLGEDGGRETRSENISPPVFCFAKSSPLVRGGLGCALNRICGDSPLYTRGPLVHTEPHLRWWGATGKRKNPMRLSARPVGMICALNC